MALKLNIRPEIEKEMDDLLKKGDFHSKTEYINEAIQDYNKKLKRLHEVEKLKSYFQIYRKEGEEILNEFARIRDDIH